eukprot:TRINITY_DN47841_c0_g1_i1.p1 TRINITY_DN47841_c0_g1~~TRINITY_DN47841_c0_g1_i1.p1  ORF type:complete len:116 (+),score=8.71 TRINITY_DN47841_c0_g1_i1:588-935(+)
MPRCSVPSNVLLIVACSLPLSSLYLCKASCPPMLPAPWKSHWCCTSASNASCQHSVCLCSSESFLLVLKPFNVNSASAMLAIERQHPVGPEVSVIATNMYAENNYCQPRGLRASG